MDKFLSSLALCYKSGNLKVGFDSVKELMATSNAALVFITRDLSEKTRKEVCFLAQKKEIKVWQLLYSMEDIDLIIHKKAGVLAIQDKNFAKLFQRQLG